MNSKKYKIVINTIGISLEELSETLESIKDSFVKGYVVGSGWNDAAQKSYDFETTEV